MITQHNHSSAPSSPPLKSPKVIVTLQSHPLRPLTLKHGSVELQLLIPHEIYTFAEQLKEELVDSVSALAPIPSSDEGMDKPDVSEMELFTRYLSLAQAKATDVSAPSYQADSVLSTTSPYLPLLLNLFKSYQTRFCSRNNLHAVIAPFEQNIRELILSTYYSTLKTLVAASLINSNDYQPPRPALFALTERKPRPGAAVFAVFGGQGNTTDLLAELVTLYQSYHPFLKEYIKSCSDLLVSLSQSGNDVGSFFGSKGLNIMKWIQSRLNGKEDEIPQEEYLISAPVSLPLIGLIQLSWYLALVKVTERPFDVVQKWFCGTTGHSQGIVSAVVLASSDSYTSFVENSLKALKLLFYIGVRSHQVFPTTTLNPKITMDSIEHNESTPSPMLSISSLPVPKVQQYIDATNRHLPQDRKVYISLINGPRSVVVSGPPQSLYGLNVALRKLKNDGQDQSRVPYSQRRIKFTSRFLNVTAPFHSVYLEKAIRIIKEDIARDGIHFQKEYLNIPVYCTDDGTNLQVAKREDISLWLVEQICRKPVHWEKATAAKPLTHVVDFGPGASIGLLTQRNKEGTGVQVLLAHHYETSSNELLGRSHLFNSDPNSVKFSPNWARDFCPRLIKTASNGEIYIDTKFSRLLGKPPLMVAGMTPSTVHEDFVSAVINAGYHVELAGGGHYNEKALRTKVNRIMQRVDPGEGITLNILFLNPRQWGFQYPLVQVMRREGYPIEGVCVAAGVPSPDVADDIITSLKDAGIRHVSFKPGSASAIRSVCNIAARHPDMPIILQWTGGRAGGHHSYEDFHAPLLETYGLIRRHSNIVLVGGSGFGDADGTLPYLTGDWSLNFNYPQMPLDGILFGSRMMVAKEGRASTPVKELIVKATGIENEKDWEVTYKKPIGGVVTVKSELGEPIHKIATRGVMLWKEFDETIFSLPKDKRIKILQEKREYIIKRLNEDFQKVWFGRKTDGSVADLTEMTYTEVAFRLGDLLYIKHLSTWIDASYRSLLFDFLKRLEERFSTSVQPSALHSSDLIDNPNVFLPTFLANFEDASLQLLTTEDVLYFIDICQQRGRKPVPFIPVLDEKFEVWFKKDSLWQAEFIDAVVDRDPGRVCILHGPVAARYSTKVNEPVKDILDGIYHSHINSIKDRYYQGRDETIPVIGYFGGSQVKYTGDSLRGVSVSLGTDSKIIHLSTSPASLPALREWLEFLSGPTFNWLRALLTSHVIQGHLFIDNPMCHIFKPRPGQTVKIHYSADVNVKSISIYDAGLKRGESESLNERKPSVVASIVGDLIRVVLYENIGETIVPLELKFRYAPEKGYAPIREVMEDRNDRIKDFYSQLWFTPEETRALRLKLTDADAFTKFNSTFTINRKSVSEFLQVIGNYSELYLSSKEKLIAPMDFGIVASWKAIISSLFMKVVDGDLLKLVHLSNGFRLLDQTRLLQESDICETVAEVVSIRNSDSGKAVKVKAVIHVESRPVMEVLSSFFIRGKFDDHQNTFEKIDETPMQMDLQSNKDIEILKSKSWITFFEQVTHLVQPGSSLIFRLRTYTEFAGNSTLSRVHTEGTVTMQIQTKEIIQIGTVHYNNDEPIQYGNPVMSFLERFGRPIEQPVHFHNGGYAINTAGDESIFQSPASNLPYSKASGDFNPIHVNPYFADYAQLPSTITHGMWTSAASRKFVEIFAADNQPERVVSYDVKFESMVIPGDRLETKLYHVGMKNGRKTIRLETVNQHGTKVLSGIAEVEQPRTAYVFTGQGSQEQNMGMSLYNSSDIARNIWDRADVHFKNNYGFSILEIVRDNPTSKTIYFGGAAGQRIRQNYMRMTYEVMDSDGSTKSLPLFPEIDNVTFSYTFKAHNGLLSSTQFTQPALVLLEIASFEDMKSKGLVQQNSMFAGHSLGEYAALSSVGDVLPIESLVDIVFYRGMSMQNAVPRDSNNRSNYGMVAVNPSRVGPGFDQSALDFVIAAIHEKVESLMSVEKLVLEIVNYNVENWQYVVAGDLFSLDVLSGVLNRIKGLKVNFNELRRSNSIEIVRNHLNEIIEDARLESAAKNDKNGMIVLDRGYATIPLPVDVPFHSSFLLPGVAPFRRYLMNKIKPTYINVNLLTGNYIPNLTAKPFEVSLEYIQMVYRQTQSPTLQSILRDWKHDSQFDAQMIQDIGHLLLIELLSYQFASSVRWIETQDVLFKVATVERLIEIGPTPTLANMAIRTLKLKYSEFDDAVSYRRSNLCYARDHKEIYYEIEEAQPMVSVEQSIPLVAVPAESNTEATSNLPTVARAAPILDDLPLTATEVLNAIIAQKLKKSIEEVPSTKSIKELSGGKSTLQNEILGDLQKEFGNNAVPDKSEESSLEELGAQLESSFDGSLGKHSSSLVSKMLSSKMPGGFSATSAKNYLSTTFGFGPLRSDAVLLIATTMEPSVRLSSETEAKSFLESVAKKYASKHNMELNSGLADIGQSAAVAMINSEEFNQFVGKQDALIRSQIDAFIRYLDMDINVARRLLVEQKGATSTLRKQLDLWLLEHGETYAEGLTPLFSPLKARRFDSSWNWVRSDALQLYFDIIFGKLKKVDRALVAKCLHVMNRASSSFLYMMKYWIESIPDNSGETYKLVKELGTELMKNCEAALSMQPVYKLVEHPTAPRTYVALDGTIEYKEIPREGTRNMSLYVKEMTNGSSQLQHRNNCDTPNEEELQILNEIIASSSFPNIDKYKTHLRNLYQKLRNPISPIDCSKNIPFLHLKRQSSRDPAAWIFDQEHTQIYLSCLTSVAEDGLSLTGRTVLLTGCGKESIGSEILKSCLSSGAQVIVTTSRFSKEVTEYYRHIYEKHGSRGSCLIVVPFNQGSKTDLEKLVSFIYSKEKDSLGWDLDFVIPFAAISENGREITAIDSKSELAHRIMLTNLVRLLGLIAKKKEEMGYESRPAQVILPLSPNHGTFGGDGLYGESKISLETLMNRWCSESWSSYLSIAGAVIGWTRGTGLMSSNNIVSEGVENLGVRTFATNEMAFNIMGLMHPKIVNLAQHEPLWVDLAGGMNYISNLNEIVTSLRKDIVETADVQRAVENDRLRDAEIVYGPLAEGPVPTITPRANLKFPDFPTLKSTSEIHNLGNFNGLIDLDKVVVVTGFGEVGPYGNARLRWEMEAFGKFSLEGTIELAWIMGLIRFHRGPLKNGQNYTGWVDANSGEPVKDFEIKSRYENKILDHTGVRLIEPENFNGYDPKRKSFLQEIVVDHDLNPFEASKEEAEAFRLSHGEFVDVFELPSGEYSVKIRKGATLYIPKALKFDRLVAGQIPTGWNAERYGVPKDIIDQVDPITLFVLVATVEALVNSGITDPYEFYKYVHVTEVGNTSGSGVGGMRSNSLIYKNRFLDKPVQKDILQESFINTMPAWVNLLLLSSSGPIKTPVGACATAVESVEIGFETIVSGKAKIVVVGGFDDFQEEGSYEFANMKATSNAEAEFACGREPKEMSRPCTSSRSGFMESQGAGIQILMSAKIALEMGVPIYGIVALTNTATDKCGRSVPAPGQGILTTAREMKSCSPSPLLDMKYRTRQIERQRRQIKIWVEEEIDHVRAEAENLKSSMTDTEVASFIDDRTSLIEREAERQEKAALSTWGNDFYKNDQRIAPLRGALAVWGLTIDDINFASFHGTGTKANDVNESDVLNRQFSHLGRTKGNVCPGIFQKYLTGHPKGAAAGFMLNGALQVLNTGLIPGNRNADNIDEKLQAFEYILYPSRSIQTDGLKAGLLKSFGFGQVGGEILIIHPDYLFTAISESEYSEYILKRNARQTRAYRYLHDSMAGVSEFVQVKSSPPYSSADESKVYLDPTARASYNSATKTYSFDLSNALPDSTDAKGEIMNRILEELSHSKSNRGVGVDVELVSSINIHNETFLSRNFSPREIEYCMKKPDVQSSFAGKWAAKESVIKAISSYRTQMEKVWTQGAAAPLKDIEVITAKSGAPEVVLHGEALQAAAKVGVKELKVTISHSGSYAVALCSAF
ncbi:fatty acid synthase [Paraphysoderma sedebokerense]|nr:fatty acid synthase [Paraphysoderma sedebokerense]